MTPTSHLLTPPGAARDAAVAPEQPRSEAGQEAHASTSNPYRDQSTITMPPRPGFRDATSLLTSACADLRAGEMVAVPDFTLMDSMAAVKIMDARMDSGMDLPVTELPESDRLDGTTESADDFDPFRPLTVPDLLWIMDRLLACEAAWHQGSALSQTLYTCLYFHWVKSLSPKHPRFQTALESLDETSSPSDPKAESSAAGHNEKKPPQLVYKVLRAFVLATVKTIDIAWSELTSKQHLHDGEDFASDKNGLSLLETTDTGYVIAELEDALEWIQSQQGVLPVDHLESLKARLTFRKQMLYAVKLLQSPAEAAPLDVVMHTKFARRSWTLLKPTPPPPPTSTATLQGKEMARNVGEATSAVVPIQPPNRNAAPSTAAVAAFDPAYNRRLAWCQALRPISLPGADETWHILDSILEELQDVVRVLQHPGFLAWKTFFTHRAIHFQASEPVSATPYIRSLMQTAVCDRNTIASRLPLEWIAETFFQEVALIDPLLLRRASKIGRNNVEGGLQSAWNAPPPLGQRVHYFQQRVAGHLVQYLSTLSQNRSRCKRTLASRLYRDWVNISEEASEIGHRLEKCLAPSEGYIPDSLFAATQHLALEIMTQITFSGFELDLYGAGTDSESMWWLASRIQVEQAVVCTDLRDELSKRLEMLAPEQRPRRHSTTILYLSRQILLAQALEQLAVGTIFLMHHHRQNTSSSEGEAKARTKPWLLSPQESSSNSQTEMAVFANRIKWMRTSSARGTVRNGDSNQADPGETLWEDYLAFRGELDSTDDNTLASLAKQRLDQAITHLQHLTGSFGDEQRQELGVQQYRDFVAALSSTAQHNRNSLNEATRARATTISAVDDASSPAAMDRKPKRSTAHREWIFEHPWFPKWSRPSPPKA